MARQEINLGTSPTGLGGDPPRTASQKINFMTKELYASVESMGTAATRNVQVNALDNSAGKLLGPGAFGLGSGAPGAADLFALPGSGFYYSNPGGGTLNPMSNAAGLTLHAGGGNSGGGGFQLYGRDNTFLFRGFTNGAHSATRMVYHDGNAVGLVGAGAIIESGSNSNGEFTKFADGTLICRAVGRAYTFLNASVIAHDWIYPQSFVGMKPSVLPVIVGDLATIRQLSGVTAGGGSALSTIRLAAVSKALFVAGDVALGTFDVIAIGRWKV